MDLGSSYHLSVTRLPYSSEFRPVALRPQLSIEFAIIVMIIMLIIMLSLLSIFEFLPIPSKIDIRLNQVITAVENCKLILMKM